MQQGTLARAPCRLQALRQRQQRRRAARLLVHPAQPCSPDPPTGCLVSWLLLHGSAPRPLSASTRCPGLACVRTFLNRLASLVSPLLFPCLHCTALRSPSSPVSTAQAGTAASVEREEEGGCSGSGGGARRGGGATAENCSVGKEAAGVELREGMVGVKQGSGHGRAPGTRGSKAGKCSGRRRAACAGDSTPASQPTRGVQRASDPSAGRWTQQAAQ